MLVTVETVQKFSGKTGGAFRVNLGIGALMNSGSLHLSDMLVSMKNVLVRVKVRDFTKSPPLYACLFNMLCGEMERHD